MTTTTDDDNGNNPHRCDRLSRPTESPSAAAATATTRTALQCRYANKTCLRPRTTKRYGGLHAFCEFHRDNANESQRRLDRRKRRERRQAEAIRAYRELLAAEGRDPLTWGDERATARGGPDGPWAILTSLEPLMEPAELLHEDLEALCGLLGLGAATESTTTSTMDPHHQLHRHLLNCELNPPPF